MNLLDSVLVTLAATPTRSTTLESPSDLPHYLNNHVMSQVHSWPSLQNSKDVNTPVTTKQLPAWRLATSLLGTDAYLAALRNHQPLPSTFQVLLASCRWYISCLATSMIKHSPRPPGLDALPSISNEPWPLRAFPPDDIKHQDEPHRLFVRQVPRGELHISIS